MEGGEARGEGRKCDDVASAVYYWCVLVVEASHLAQEVRGALARGGAEQSWCLQWSRLTGEWPKS